jgi:hypothetical protein
MYIKGRKTYATYAKVTNSFLIIYIKGTPNLREPYAELTQTYALLFNYRFTSVLSSTQPYAPPLTPTKILKPPLYISPLPCSGVFNIYPNLICSV